MGNMPWTKNQMEEHLNLSVHISMGFPSQAAGPASSFAFGSPCHGIWIRLDNEAVHPKGDSEKVKSAAIFGDDVPTFLGRSLIIPNRGMSHWGLPAHGPFVQFGQ